jgi:molybdopterin synthase catalytic subunit
MKIEVRADAFDPIAELRDYEQALRVHGKLGATVSFVGTMRDYNEGAAVQAMTLEHYSGMTEKYLQALCDEAGRRWELLDALVVHRVGDIKPGEPIVLAATWAPHRAAAFDACRYLIEELKARAPFWKKEQLAEGVRWVERNT